MFEDSISRIRGSCGDCDGGGEYVSGWVMKIAPKKLTDILDFFGTIFITHRGSFDDSEWGKGKNHGQKSQTYVFDFFSAIFVTHRGSCDDCDVVGECVGGWATKIGQKNSTDVFNFFSVIFVMHRGSCDDCDGAGECVCSWVTKIATEKIKPTFSIISATIFVIQVPPS